MSRHTRGFGWVRSLGFSLLIAVLMFSVLPVWSPIVHSAVSAPGSDDWWMFHHDLQHTGHSTSTAPNTNNILWNYTTESWVDSSPAVADGKVYVGSYDDKVYCLNAANGAHIWNYTTYSYVYSSPTVADGKVFVGSYDSKVYCFGLPTTASLVVRDGDNKVWYRTYSSGVWGTWYPIAAATGDSLGATMLGNNLHIVARNMAGTTIWHSYLDVTDDAFSGWTLISGHPVSKPTLTS